MLLRTSSHGPSRPLWPPTRQFAASTTMTARSTPKLQLLLTSIFEQSTDCAATSLDWASASVTELFDLDRLDTSNVENTSYMFLNCLTLKAVSILGWEASGITDVGQMLSGCSTYILATEEQREFLNKITGSTQHGIWTRNLS